MVLTLSIDEEESAFLLRANEKFVVSKGYESQSRRCPGEIPNSAIAE